MQQHVPLLIAPLNRFVFNVLDILLELLVLLILELLEITLYQPHVLSSKRHYLALLFGVEDKVHGSLGLGLDLTDTFTFRATLQFSLLYRLLHLLKRAQLISQYTAAVTTCTGDEILNLEAFAHLLPNLLVEPLSIVDLELVLESGAPVMLLGGEDLKGV